MQSIPGCGGLSDDLVELTDNAEFDATPTFSPDGLKILFQRGPYPLTQLWTVDLRTLTVLRKSAPAVQCSLGEPARRN